MWWATYLDGLGIKLQALFLINQELLDIFALVTLKLDHLAHLRVVDNGAIASEFLLDHLKDLLLVELLGKALDSGQRLATIALCVTWYVSNLKVHIEWPHSHVAKISHRYQIESRGKLTLNTDVNVVLGLLSLPSVFIGFGEGVCESVSLAHATI